MAISSSELNLFDSLTISPDPLGGILEVLDLFDGLSGPFDEAGPGFGLSIGETWLVFLTDVARTESPAFSAGSLWE